MTSTKGRLALSMMLVTLCCGVSMSMAAKYRVGDAPGWTRKVPVDYAKWAAGKKFLVGDTLVFEYNTTLHNVMEVSKKNFKSCNSTAPIALYNSGYDEIKLKRPGYHYFICGKPGHCQSGHKVRLRASAIRRPSLEKSQSGTKSEFKKSPKFKGTTPSKERKKN